jgi:hypothetical protein
MLYFRPLAFALQSSTCKTPPQLHARQLTMSLRDERGDVLQVRRVRRKPLVLSPKEHERLHKTRQKFDPEVLKRIDVLAAAE